MIAYLDTSAAMKLVVREDESLTLTSHLRRVLASHDGDRVAASWLLHAELYCALGRRPDVLTLDRVEAVLNRTDLIDMQRADLLAAASGSHRLRTSDAIHLAVALRVGCDAMITYDAELQAASREAGLDVVAPA